MLFGLESLDCLAVTWSRDNAPSNWPQPRPTESIFK